MKNISMKKAVPASSTERRGRKIHSGFSLVEMMVAVFVFMVVAGAAFSLINQHMPLFKTQQDQSQINMGLRNAVAQLEIDVVNAGSGYTVPTVSPSPFPHAFGLTITNTAGGACYNAATFTYGANCFDTLVLLSMDTKTPVCQPTANPPINANNSSTFVTPVDATQNMATVAANFKSGDVVLVVQTDGTNITHMAAVALTSDGQVTGGKIKLAHNPQGDASAVLGVNSGNTFSNDLNYQFSGPPNTYVFRLNPPIIYGVNAANPANPVLYKQVGLAGAQNVLAEQVIGFKVGAMIWNGADAVTYNFNASAQTTAEGCVSNCGYDSNWPAIRSVMVSVIGRTVPDTSLSFRNTFDGGPYKVEPISVVINPRNLSMND